MIDRKVRTALFWMIGIGIMVYCVAESNLTLAMLTLPVWALAWPMSMGRDGKPIPKLVLGVIALGLTVQALAAALTAPEDFVSAVSRYIVWLQLLKLYDRREPNDVAQAMALSVFLVLGSCLTSNSMWLGIGLLIYTPAALWGITIYQLYAEQSRTAAARQSPAPLTNNSLAQLRRLGFVSGLAAAGVATLVFLFMPRGYGEGFLGDVGVIEPTSATGVPEEIRLGESGFISSSSAEVMEVIITNPEGENIGARLQPAYFRAMTLDEYANGRWRQSQRLTSARLVTSAVNRSNPYTLRALQDDDFEVAGLPIYIQHYRFLNNDRLRLLTINRAIRLAPDTESPRRIQLNPHDVTFQNFSGVGVASYTVWSQPDAPRIPPERPRNPNNVQTDWRYERAFVGTEAHKLALELLADAGLERDPEIHITEADHAIAGLFEEHLRNNYAYTLEMIAPEPGEDPIDMFLSRTMAGHCEYFASTMAAMLRSVGIDARVATGYAATEFDESLGAFVIRESQAHAWVEARTEPNRWRTYDPSPSAEVITAHQGPTGIAGAARRLLQFTNAFWIDHIIGFDRTRQQEAMGDQSSRLRRFFERLWPTPHQNARGDSQIEEFRKAGMRTLIGAAIQVTGLVLAAFGLSVALIVLLRRFGALRERRRNRRSLIRGDPEYAIRRRQSAFYRRYLRLLRAAGAPPAPSTPPLAHAQSLSSRSPELARHSVRLTMLYYKLRFGRTLLTSDELDEADRLLTRIAGALRSVRNAR